jgi:predicted RNA-binding protein with PIN domain
VSHARHLIVIDGYNLIHRSPELKPGSDRTLAEARTKLVNLLSWAVGGDEVSFLVVFDGAGDVHAPETGSARVQVRYARPPLSADDVIRQVVEEKVERVDRLTVVTADLEVARHARAMGATIALSDLFLGSLLGPGRVKAEGEKPTSLSKKELEEWAEMFRRRGNPDSDES